MRGVLRYRHSNRLLHEAMRREQERQRRRRGGGFQMLVAVGGDRPEPPDVYEELVRFWWQPPDRLREEVESPQPYGSRTTVRDGELWWHWSPATGAISNAALDEEERLDHAVGGGERFRPLLDPSGLLAVLELGEVEAAGSRLRVRATRRDDVDLLFPHSWPLPLGGDVFELEVDRVTGLLRRAAAFIDGEELAAVELEQLALDEEFPEGTFVFVPPPGEEVQAPETGRQRPRTLEEVAAEAPFAVFAPRELPEGDWRLHAHFHEARARPPVAATALLVYHRADGRGSLVVSEQQADAERGRRWTGPEPSAPETVERDGVRYTLGRGDPERGLQHLVALERDGTAIELRSQELPPEALLEVATTLDRAAG